MSTFESHSPRSRGEEHSPFALCDEAGCVRRAEIQEWRGFSLSSTKILGKSPKTPYERKKQCIFCLSELVSELALELAFV